MKIAVPTAEGLLFSHFGHAPKFSFFDIDPETKAITSTSVEKAPPHQPGHIPKWLLDHAITHVVVGNMGENAKRILEHKGVTVICGAPEMAPEQIAKDYVEGRLVSTPTPCDHSHGHGVGHGHGHGN